MGVPVFLMNRGSVKEKTNDSDKTLAIRGLVTMPNILG